MLLQSPLHTVTSSLDADVLQVLAGAEVPFTTTRLAELTGRSVPGVRLVLRRLVDQGVVVTVGAGRSHSYTLNREHLAAGPIIALASLREALIERLRERIATWGTPPVYAALFGSGARGQMTDTSDIDLFLVRPRGASERFDDDVHALAQQATAWTGNPVHPLVMRLDEISGAKSAEPVLADIAEHGLAVFGEASAFRKVIR
ncbi:MAG: nucleotidyltransferase domain-containing protein [Demequina sp.]